MKNLVSVLIVNNYFYNIMLDEKLFIILSQCIT